MRSTDTKSVQLRLVLTPEEETLYNSIDPKAEGPAPWAENGRRTKALLAALRNRGALPAIRLRYFTDPELNIGGHGCSRLERFERNLMSGDIWSHPHFVKYLRYFIEGPRLPPAAVDRFSSVAAETFREWGALAKCARGLAATIDFSSPSDAAEEFFKLALELEASLGEAEHIRHAAAEGFRRRRRC